MIASAPIDLKSFMFPLPGEEWTGYSCPWEFTRIGNATVYLGDCLEILPWLAAHDLATEKASLCITDPPYGCSRCSWDKPIDLGQFWSALRSVTYERAALCLFCQMPFAAELYASNRRNFRYDLVYRKARPVGFLNCNRMPLRDHELIFVFYAKRPVYVPQLKPGQPYSIKKHYRSADSVYGIRGPWDYHNPGCRHPRSVLDPDPDGELLHGCTATRSGSLRHQTQKNVSTLAFLIRSYSHPGYLIIDPLMGTGSTGVAALRTGRRFIGVEKERRFYDAAIARLEQARACGEDLLLDPQGYAAKLLQERKDGEEETCGQ